MTIQALRVVYPERKNFNNDMDNSGKPVTLQISAWKNSAHNIERGLKGSSG